MEKRMNYVDMARGIAIILVMTGHSILFPACGAIHIPTFFALAGFVITRDGLGKNTLQGCLKKRALRLLYPYAFYSMVLFLLQIVKDMAAGAFSLAETGKNLFGILYSSTFIWNRQEDKFLCFRVGNEGLWFLTAMVMACIVFYLIVYKLASKPESEFWAGCCMAALLLVPAGWVLELLPVYLPWGLDIALLGAAFMFLGMLLRGTGWLENFKPAVAITVIGAVGFLVLNHFNGEANMAIHLYGKSRWLFMLSGLCSSMCMIGFCRVIEGIGPVQRVLSYIGKNTLFILAFHTMVFGVWDKVFEIIGVEFAGLWIVRLLLTLVVCLVGQAVLEKVFRVPRKFL